MTIGNAAEACKLPEQRIVFGEIPAKPKPRVQRDYEIRLPQMTNCALSENWLLKEMGDIHWELVSKGIEQPSSQFKNTDGDRLCAAFVRTRYSMSPLNHFRENEILDMQGNIHRLGTSLYLSKIDGYSNNQFIKAELMSCFSAVGQYNNDICKSLPVTRVNHIHTLEQPPVMLGELRKVRKQQSGTFFSGNYLFDLTDYKLDCRHYTINPYYEINGVGLLYFAAYPFISDQCALNFFNKECPELEYGKKYHTVHRDIFYYANCRPDEIIRHEINDIQSAGKAKLMLSTSMYRESDGLLMARILSVKQCATQQEHSILWSKY